MSTIKTIQERNRRVETDKAWETSKTRRAIIAVLTYIVVVVTLYLIDAPYPWLNACVPVIGYLLSTLSLPLLKKMWVKKYQQ